MSPTDFAIVVTSVGELFWPFEARPMAERSLNADVRWALLDEWDRVRNTRPTALTIFAPASERDHTDEQAVIHAIRKTLHRASGPLRRVEPLTRQEKIAFWLGIIVWVATIIVATLLDRASDDVFTDVLSQAVVLFGWVALWPPASRLLTQVIPHMFNRRRFAEFADVDVRFVWTGRTAT